MNITDFLSLEKPAKEDRIKIDVLNDNTDKIDNHFKRNSIVLSATGRNISVSATGPYYEVTNNTENSVQVLLEGTMNIILDPGETQKVYKNMTDTFTLTASCTSDITVTYFQRNKDYVDGSLASDLANYYDKSDSDSIFLKTEDFSDMRNEESSSVCSVVLPLKYNAIGNPVEEYRIHGDTPQQTGAVSPDFPKPVSGTGDLITDEQSEHYGKYALPIINNGTTYNVYLDLPLYRVKLQSDYVDYARQKVVRNVGVITYDGSTDETWEALEYQKYRIALSNLGGGTNMDYPYEVLCDKLTDTSASGVGIFNNKIGICGGYVYAHFDSTLTTVEEFKTYLASNPITVYYPLASEIAEDVTLPELLTISGENQLYVNTTVTPKNVVVGALMQYITRKDMNDTFPGLDNVYTKLEVNSMVNSLNAEVVTKAESVNDINQINGNISLTLDDVPDGDGRKMAGLATETYVNSAIGNVNSFNVLVVQSLPTVDIQQHTIYFVPKTPSENGDVYDEYMYINNAWEHIGTSAADLSSYYTKAECNDAFAVKSHTHNYAGSDGVGGAANLAKKLDNTTAIGSVTQPVYFNASGVPVPTSYTVEKSVPSNAVFTDTTYSLATTSANGLLSSTDKKKINIAGPQFAYCTADTSSTGYYKITINNALAWMMSFDVCIYHWYHCYNLCVSGYNYGANHWSNPKVITTSSTSPAKYMPVTFGYNSDGKLWFAVPAAPYTGILITDMNQGLNAPITDFSGLFTVEKVTELTGTTQTTVNAYRPVYVNEGLVVTTVPTSATATGTKGEIAYDSNYMYTCIATNTWKKTAFDAYTYSTTETVVGTYNGKPLYRKIVDCGALPNNTTKEVTHGIANINIFTNITGSAWDSNGTTIPLPTASLTSPVVMYSDKSKIYITTTTDRSTMINSNVIIEYTKTTD